MARLRRERGTARDDRDEARGRVRQLEEELEQARADPRERIAVLEGELEQAWADLSTWTAELEELSRAAAAVTSFTFGSNSASGSSTASRLEGVPDVVMRSIAEGMRLGSYLMLMSAGGLYKNLDLEAISQGCPSVRTVEEMAALSQAAEASMSIITSRVPTDEVLKAARNSEPRPEDGGEDRGADGGDVP
jgi:hypothetical protein